MACWQDQGQEAQLLEVLGGWQLASLQPQAPSGRRPWQRSLSPKALWRCSSMHYPPATKVERFFLLPLHRLLVTRMKTRGQLKWSSCDNGDDAWVMLRWKILRTIEKRCCNGSITPQLPQRRTWGFPEVAQQGLLETRPLTGPLTTMPETSGVQNSIHLSDPQKVSSSTQRRINKMFQHQTNQKSIDANSTKIHS